jgi:hypothetical protein
MRWSTRVKDEEGYPAFALVNKATGEAIKHSIGKSHAVRMHHRTSALVQYSLQTKNNDSAKEKVQNKP